jgi:hypothetical protein
MKEKQKELLQKANSSCLNETSGRKQSISGNLYMDFSGNSIKHSVVPANALIFSYWTDDRFRLLTPLYQIVPNVAIGRQGKVIHVAVLLITSFSVTLIYERIHHAQVIEMFDLSRTCTRNIILNNVNKCCHEIGFCLTDTLIEEQNRA